MASQRSCGAFLLAGPSKACFRKGLTAKKHLGNEVTGCHSQFAGPLREERDSGGPPAAGISEGNTTGRLLAAFIITDHNYDAISTVAYNLFRYKVTPCVSSESDPLCTRMCRKGVNENAEKRPKIVNWCTGRTRKCRKTAKNCKLVYGEDLVQDYVSVSGMPCGGVSGVTGPLAWQGVFNLGLF